MNDREFQSIVEKLDVLNGTRRHGKKEGAAVRLFEMLSLRNFSYKLKSKKLTNAPTINDYNALVDDVHALHSALQDVSKALVKREGLNG